MKHLIKTTWKLSLVAVCLCVFVPPVGGQGCLEHVGELGGDFSALAVSGDHAYLGSGSFLLVVNVSDPTTPWGESAFWIGGFPDPVEILDIAISDGFAYVTYFGGPGGPMGGWVGVKVIDVSTPSAPFEVSDLPWSAMVPSGIDVEDGFAYVSHHCFGSTYSIVTLYVFDVSDPLNPTEVGYATHGDGFTSARDVAVSGEYAYVANWDSLRVVDVSTPSAPVEIGFLAVPQTANAVGISGSYAYVIESPAGMWVLDVSNPAAPVDVGFLPTPGTATDVAVSNGYAYVADSGPLGWSSVRAIDLSTPSTPFEVASAQWRGEEVHQVAVSGDYVYVTSGVDGMRIFRKCSMFFDGFESGDTSAWSSTVP